MQKTIETKMIAEPLQSAEAGRAETARIANRFRQVRRRTTALCEPLTPEDMMVQSCPEASPAKWHLAHTAWFFESFILREFLPGYRLFNQDFPWLFNSYYETFSQFPEKRLRSSFSRPSLDEVLRYREHVDEGIERLLDGVVGGEPHPEALRRIELGANHEEQHQELMLTDVLNAFFTNPLRPEYRKPEAGDRGIKGPRNTSALQFMEFDGGLREVGNSGDSFCFDNEMPRHRVWLEPFALANRLVTCGEYAAFIADGGYRRSELWLSAGWDTIKSQGWRAPLYWTNLDPTKVDWTKQDDGEDGRWSIFTLRGARTLEDMAETPVSQVSFYEADAYARWAGLRLPTEFEWEAAAQGLPGKNQPIDGNLLDSGLLVPAAADGRASLYGDCWQWTSSAYLGYPGFQPLNGTLGEYNGKFMSGQMILRGGSCVTPRAHIRASYRNFFPPETRWQFSGIRLAR